MNTRNLILKIIASISLAALTAGAMADLKLSDGTATGSWFDPARSGEGFFVEIAGEGENQQIVIAMYSFDENGNQLWFTGNKLINKDDRQATLQVIQVKGPTWGAGFDVNDEEVTEFGTLYVRFPSCTTALFDVESNVPALESYSYTLQRLTSITGIDCVNEPAQDPGDDPPPSVLSTGLWEGSGACFFVNDTGTKIVESEQCDGGKSVFGDDEGAIVNTDGIWVPDMCQVTVSCEGSWDIIPDDSFGRLGYVSCTGDGGAINIYFNSATQANVEVWQQREQPGTACLGIIVTRPAD